MTTNKSCYGNKNKACPQPSGNPWTSWPIWVPIIVVVFVLCVLAGLHQRFCKKKNSSKNENKQPDKSNETNKNDVVLENQFNTKEETAELSFYEEPKLDENEQFEGYGTFMEENEHLEKIEKNIDEEKKTKEEKEKERKKDENEENNNYCSNEEDEKILELIKPKKPAIFSNLSLSTSNYKEINHNQNENDDETSTNNICYI